MERDVLGRATGRKKRDAGMGKCNSEADGERRQGRSKAFCYAGFATTIPTDAGEVSIYSRSRGLDRL
jgi:hypothetical protein